MPEASPLTFRSLAGTLVCRALVPLWIFTGATFKLLGGNPALLPREMLRDAHRLGIDLDVLLATLISIEYLVALVLLLVGRIARPVAIFQLSVFCLVLLREVAAGNSSCGCLGTNSPSPWVMLFIDAALLLGAAWGKPRLIGFIDRARWPVPATVVFFLLAAALTFRTIAPFRAPPPRPPQDEPALVPPSKSAAPVAPLASDLDPTTPLRKPDLPPQLPRHWFWGDYQMWLGQRWDQIDLIAYLLPKPKDLADGTRYLVFYSRACTHCETMFAELAARPDLAARVTAVEIPYTADRLRAPDPWPMPDTACEMLALPLGCDWIITPPLSVRLEDGVVRCADEGGHADCLGLGEGVG